MIIKATAPSRISLFGGGTDIPSFYEKYGGIVISMAINIKQHIELETKDDGIFGGLEMPDHANHNFYRAFAEEMDFTGTYKSKFDADIQTGLGSSASCAVVLVGAIARAKGLKMTRSEIAEKAWDIEVNKIGLFGGKQDQYAAAFGGMNVIIFGEKVEVKPVNRLAAEDMVDHLLLFDTGLRRTEPKLQENLKIPSSEQIRALLKMSAIALKAAPRLFFKDYEGLASLLQESWKEKKKSNKISTSEIDTIYNVAIESGAMAGKLLGSGGGGCMVFIVKPDKRKEVINALGKLGCKHLDFSIDWNGLGVRTL